MSTPTSLPHIRATAYYERALEFLNAYFELSLAHSYQKVADKDLQLASAKLTLVSRALELTLRGWLALRESAQPAVMPADAMDRDPDERAGHDLLALAQAVAPLCPGLWAQLDNGTIARLNASYLADVSPDGALPDDRATITALAPFDNVANMVGKLRHDLGVALDFPGAATSAPEQQRQRRRHS